MPFYETPCIIIIISTLKNCCLSVCFSVFFDCLLSSDVDFVIVASLLFYFCLLL